jgi:hypothetical protein
MKTFLLYSLVAFCFALICTHSASADGCGQIRMYEVDVECCPNDPNPTVQEDVFCGNWGSCRNYCYESYGECSYCYLQYRASSLIVDSPWCVSAMEQCHLDGGVWKPLGCQCYLTPIIIDIGKPGLRLTSSVLGVEFQFSPTGQKIRVAWTEGGTDGDAFLVLDRNNNGIIENGTELFGNFTPQPASGDPNGFLALAVFDKGENEGNGDDIIDDQDAVFRKLRLWVDANHDGISQPEELHTLPERGVLSLSLSYRESGREDRLGNMYRYRAMVNPHIHEREANVGRWAYDVYFLRARTTLSMGIGAPSSRCGAGRNSASASPDHLGNDSPAPATQADAPNRRLP